MCKTINCSVACFRKFLLSWFDELTKVRTPIRRIVNQENIIITVYFNNAIVDQFRLVIWQMVCFYSIVRAPERMIESKGMLEMRTSMLKMIRFIFVLLIL